MRRCFERVNGKVHVDGEIRERISDLAKEAANQLLTDNTDVDYWDLEALFKSEFGYFYQLACLQDRKKGD